MVEELGFDGIKLILESTGNLDTCWSQKRIDDLNRLCKSYNSAIARAIAPNPLRADRHYRLPK